MLRETIKAEARKQGLTVYKLALAADLQRTQLMRYLRCETDLHGENIDKLLKALKIELRCL